MRKLTKSKITGEVSNFKTFKNTGWPHKVCPQIDYIMGLSAATPGLHHAIRYLKAPTIHLATYIN